MLYVKFKDPDLIKCRADHSLHFETNRTSLAFKMAEKFGKYGNVNTKNWFREKRRISFGSVI